MYIERFESFCDITLYTFLQQRFFPFFQVESHSPNIPVSYNIQYIQI